MQLPPVEEIRMCAQGNKTPMVEVMEYLRYIAAQKRTVNVVSNFRGVPIHLSARLVRCSPNTGAVRLRVQDRQIVSLQIGTSLLLQSDLFPQPVVAEVLQLHIEQRILILGNLCYVSGSMGQRKNVRVQPEKPIRVELTTQHGFSMPGKILDISVEGISVYLEKALEAVDESLSPGSPLKISFGLPTGDEGEIHDLTLEAQTVYLNDKPDKASCRLGLIFELNSEDQEVMRRYIFDRQTMILNEVSALNNAFLQAVAD